MIKKIFAVFLMLLLFINIIAFASVKISMLTFWINLFILYGISHLFVKYSKEEKKKKKNK